MRGEEIGYANEEELNKDLARTAQGRELLAGRAAAAKGKQLVPDEGKRGKSLAINPFGDAKHENLLAQVDPFLLSRSAGGRDLLRKNYEAARGEETATEKFRREQKERQARIIATAGGALPEDWLVSRPA